MKKQVLGWGWLAFAFGVLLYDIADTDGTYIVQTWGALIIANTYFAASD